MTLKTTPTYVESRHHFHSFSDIFRFPCWTWRVLLQRWSREFLSKTFIHCRVFGETYCTPQVSQCWNTPRNVKNCLKSHTLAEPHRNIPTIPNTGFWIWDATIDPFKLTWHLKICETEHHFPNLLLFLDRILPPLSPFAQSRVCIFLASHWRFLIPKSPVSS